GELRARGGGGSGASGGEGHGAPQAEAREDQRGGQRPEDPCRGPGLRIAASAVEEQGFRREDGERGESGDGPDGERRRFGGRHFHWGFGPLARREAPGQSVAGCGAWSHPAIFQGCRSITSAPNSTGRYTRESRKRLRAQRRPAPWRSPAIA